MTLEEYIAEKKKRLESKFETLQADWKQRYSGELPLSLPQSFEDWDEWFNDLM